MMMESLTLKSKVTFEEFKHYYSDKPKRHSAPKKDTNVPFYFEKKGNKKMNEGQTK